MSAKLCSKSGCGAIARIGYPCTDWDCPQYVVSAAEYRTIADALTAKDTALSEMRKALEATSLGLDDLMRTLYSPELYRPEHVAESHDRIGRAGAPLAYVAGLQEMAARALASQADAK